MSDTMTGPAALSDVDVSRLQVERAELAALHCGTNWRHFKGGVYRIQGFAVDADRHQLTVIYVSADHSCAWVRSWRSWVETVEAAGRARPRFEQLPGIA